MVFKSMSGKLRGHGAQNELGMLLSSKIMDIQLYKEKINLHIVSRSKNNIEIKENPFIM